MRRLSENLRRYYALQAAKNAPRKQKTEDWREARRWYQQSLEVWKSLQQRKTLSVDYANKPVEISRQLTKCEAAIAHFIK